MGHHRDSSSMACTILRLMGTSAEIETSLSHRQAHPDHYQQTSPSAEGIDDEPPLFHSSSPDAAAIAAFWPALALAVRWSSPAMIAA